MSSSTTTITVTGMTCDHCVRAVREELLGLDGVTDVAVDLASGRVTVHADRPVESTSIRGAIDEAGYEVQP